MIGTISEVIPGSNKYGPFTKLKINGETISAFGDGHSAARLLSPGDTVDYTIVQKGEYKNVGTIKKVEGSGPPPVAPATPSETLTRDESVLVSYAKDLVVSGKSPEDAVDTVFAISKMVKGYTRQDPIS